MSSIVYPSAFSQRVLANEVPAGAAARVAVYLPTIIRPRQPFDIKVAVCDAQGYPCKQYDGVVKVCHPQASPLCMEVRFTPDRPAVAAIQGVTTAAEGLVRFDAEMEGKVFHSNPAMVSREAACGIYWGDPHVHTVLSNCHAERCRSAMFAYEAGRHFSGLDWMAVADHVSNGRCELARWKEQVALNNAYNDPPYFVTLPAYEASFKGHMGGDNNIYMARWPDMFVDDYDNGSVKTVLDKLAQKLPTDEFFAVPHHTTRPGKHGEIGDDIYP